MPLRPRNPFKPTFGVSPPLLVGRDSLLRDFGESLDDGPGAPGRATIYTGARGTGKTVMLNAVQEEARSRGWLVVSETATPGLVSRLVEERLPTLLAEHDPKATKSRLSAVNMPAALGGVVWDTTDIHKITAGLRSQVTNLCEVLAPNEAGLLITVDELQRKPIDDLVQLFTVVQHAFREELELAFVGAGLPSAVSELLSEDVLTFLRRADAHLLAKVDADDVARAIKEPVEGAGRSIEPEALEIAVEATAGYPFLIQLVGHQTWRQHPERKSITPEDASAGASEARRRLGRLVHGVALDECSDIDKTFLLAMARDDGPSRMSDIARRMHVNPGYANVYRTRLLNAQLIEPAGWGRVEFALPYLREYLREHAAIEHVRSKRPNSGQTPAVQ